MVEGRISSVIESHLGTSLTRSSSLLPLMQALSWMHNAVFCVRLSLEKAR